MKKQISIRVNSDLWKQVKKKTVDENTSITKIVTFLLEMYLEMPVVLKVSKCQHT